jgi:hypothetical protein
MGRLMNGRFGEKQHTEESALSHGRFYQAYGVIGLARPEHLNCHNFTRIQISNILIQDALMSICERVPLVGLA